jgi:hypothetical protein
LCRRASRQLRWAVYTIVAEGRTYVGYTKQPVAVRIAQHRRAPPPRMRDVVARLGHAWDQHFVVTTVARVATKAAARRTEALHIERTGALGARGYNTAPSTTRAGFWYRLRRGCLSAARR